MVQTSQPKAKCILLERFAVEKLLRPSDFPSGFGWANPEWLLIVESEPTRDYVRRLLRKLKRSGRVHEMRCETLTEADFALLGFTPYGEGEVVLRPAQVSLGIKWLTGWIMFLTFFVLPSCVAVIKAAPLF